MAIDGQKNVTGLFPALFTFLLFYLLLLKSTFLLFKIVFFYAPWK